MLADWDEALDALEVLALGLVVEDVGNLACEDFTAAWSFVDADHGHAHGPWWVTDAKGHVDVVCADVLFKNAEVY